MPYLIYENQIAKMGNPKLAILPSAQALTEGAWQQLLRYVEGGGNLLVTGPVDRDEHWQRVNRAAELIPGAEALPLTFHNATQPTNRTGKVGTELSFDQQAQSWLEFLRLPGPFGFEELAHGKGQIIWASYPVELAQADQPNAELYGPVAARTGLEPQFDTQLIAPGVMAYSLPLDDSVLYIFSSDEARDTDISLTDKTTRVKLTFTLRSEHAALALIGKKEKIRLLSACLISPRTTRRSTKGKPSQLAFVNLLLS
jgi:hypothetical protein